jgi:hypothetical protein
VRFISLLRGGCELAKDFSRKGATTQRYLDSLRTVELVAGSWSMKTIMRLVFVAAIIGVIYFATIGRDQFYDLLDFFYEILGAIAGGYLKK